MPYYRGPDGSGLGFASQVQYVALYAGPAAAERARRAGLDVGRSCIRFRDLTAIDWTLLEQLIGLAGS